MNMLYGVHNDLKETLDDTVPCVFKITLIDNNDVTVVKSLQFNMYIPDTPATPAQ